MVTHIVEAYLINKEFSERRDNAEKAKNAKNKGKHKYEQLDYPKLQQTVTVDTLGTLMHFSKLGEEKTQFERIQKFVSWLQVSKQGETQRNITWLELYILYRLRGYDKPIVDHKRPGMKRATLDKQLKVFKNNFRNVISRITEGNEFAKLFKPAKQTNKSLIGVGIQGKHPSLSCNVFVTDEEREEIAKALATLNRSISDKQLNDFIAGNKGIAPHPLKLNGKTGWDSTLPILNNERRLDCRYDTNYIGDQKPVEEVAFFKCPLSSC